jgi:hypothetical protein
MFKFNTDTTEVQQDSDRDRTYTPIEEGNHICMIHKAVSGMSSAGNRMVALEWKVVGPEDKDKNKRFFDWFVFSENPKDAGTARLIKVCLSAGIKGCAVDPNGLDPTSQKSVWEHMLGKVIVVRTWQKEEEYQGKTRIKIRSGRFYPLNDTDKKAMDKAYGANGPELSSFSYEDLKGNPIHVEGMSPELDASDPFASSARSVNVADIPF